jgi:hypothetical protein
LLLRAFHLHPIMVSMQGKRDLSSLDSNTIDGDFLGYNIGDWEKIHVEQDSDNIVMFSLTGKDERRLPLVPNVASIEKVGAVAYGQSVNPLHRYFFTKAIKLHSGDLNDNWQKKEEQTAYLVYRILRQDRFMAGSYLWTFSVSEILRHLMMRARQKPVISWIRFLKRGIGAIRKRRGNVLRLELSSSVVNSLVHMQEQTTRETLTDVIIDAIACYRLELDHSMQTPSTHGRTASTTDSARSNPPTAS